MTRADFLRELPRLIQTYQPSPEVLAHITGVKLLMVIGPTGVGKTTLINQLGIAYVPSDTTRPPRPEERSGVDMIFLSDYTKLASDIQAGKFVQVALGAAGDLYATSASSYPVNGWATMPVMADVVPMFRALGFGDTLSAFITPPGYTEWMRRLGGHLEKETLDRRLAEAKRSLEFALGDSQTHFILNDQIDDAVGQIRNLLSGQPIAEREAKGRQAARECLNQLKASL